MDSDSKVASDCRIRRSYVLHHHLILGAGHDTVRNAFVRKVVRRIVVHPDRIDVEVERQILRSALAESRNHPVHTAPGN